MSKSKATEDEDDGVQFDIKSGDAYVDWRKVVEDEVRRIMAKRANRSPSRTSDTVIRNNDKDRNGTSGKTS